MKAEIFGKHIIDKLFTALRKRLSGMLFFAISLFTVSLNGQSNSEKNLHLSPIKEETRMASPNFYPKEINTDYVVQKNILYGQAKGFYTSKVIDPSDKSTFQLLKEAVHILASISERRNELPLLMDVYHSTEDNNNAKPVFLFVHGGAFFLGDKENDLQMRLTEDLLKNGFAVAAVNFRMGMKLRNYNDIKKGIYCCVQDVRAALRYLACYAEELRIDPKQIYLAGSSSGAIIALHTAFMDENEIFACCTTKNFKKRFGGINESGNALPCNAAIAGVIALWGGITDLNMIDPRNNIPALLFHGTKDDILYNESGTPLQGYLNEYMKNFVFAAQKWHGSHAIYQHMTACKMNVKYIPFVDGKHAPHAEKDGSFNKNFDVIKQEITQFLFRHSTDPYYSADNTIITLEE